MKLAAAMRLGLRTALALGRTAPALPAALGDGVDGVVRRLARRHPLAPMLRTLERTWTAREVEAQTNRYARLWRRHGVGPGDTVAVRLEARPEVLFHQLGLSRIGAAAALVSAQLPPASVDHALRVCGAHEWVVDAERQAGLDRELSRLSDHEVRAAGKDADSVFCHLFTSGTTGRPKAVPIRHRHFLMAGAGINAFGLWLDPTDVVFTPLPLYHASAQIVAWSSTLAAGACFAFTPSLSVSRYWSDARTLGATVGVYVGELCRYLLSAPPHPDEGGHSIHTFLGNGLRPDVWPDFVARFGDPRVVEFYGATEGNAFLLNRTGRVGSCGRPLFGWPANNLRLLRYDVASQAHPRSAGGRLQACETGEVGELVGRIGRSPLERFDGYTDDAATEEKTLRDVFRPGDRYFRTGDLLRRDEAGFYYFVDRIGDTFRWKGENVSTEEVAAALSGHGGAVALAVYGVRVPGCEGRAGMVALVGDFDPEAFETRAAEMLPPYARPVFVRVCPDLDRTSTMKFKKSRLQAQGFDDCGEDPVYVRTVEGYAPLDRALRDALESGRLRL